ncbi:MAG: hypothetical protein ACJA13_000242 [Paraglaciecola sp.]|jgi:hypothetical protein
MNLLSQMRGLSNEDLHKLRAMRPGMMVDLQINSPTLRRRVRTEFVGLDSSRYLIFRFPDERKWAGLDGAIYINNTMIARYILEDETGEIIAFKVKIIVVINSPSKLIFTSFPESMQSHGLRAEQRSQTRIAALLIDANDVSYIVPCLVRNISNQGCMISIGLEAKSITPKIDQRLELLIRNPNGDDITLAGVTRNHRVDETANYYGLQFDASKEETEKLLTQLLIKSEATL